MNEPFLKRRAFYMDLNTKSMKIHGVRRMDIEWVDSKGSTHKLIEMDANYINNCINKIKRNEFTPDRVAELPSLENELIYRQILKNETR